MNAIRSVLSLALLAAIAVTATACGRDSDPAQTPSGIADRVSDKVSRATTDALQKARRELAEGNIRVGGKGSSHVSVNGADIGLNTDDLPRAEITPAGDLLIDGKVVPVDEAQRKLLLEHRANVIAVAVAGIEVGMQGADLGVKAATGALKGVFGGNMDDFEKKMEAEGAKIEAAAVKICDQLRPLLDSQQALAGSLEAFRPYATLDANDVDECRSGKQSAWQASTGTGPEADSDDGDAAGPAADGGDATHSDAAAEADAAAAKASRQ